MLTITIPESDAPRSVYRTFHCSDRFAQAIAQLRASKLGFATVHDYQPTTNWKISPVQRINFQFGFIVGRLYARQAAALKEIVVADLDLSKWIPSKGKDSFATAEDQFQFCIDKMISSKTASKNRELENAHVEGHNHCYCGIRNSVKVNFITEPIKTADGKTIKRPVLDANGIPTVESILVPYLELSKVTIKEGEYKVKNSGSKVLMDNAIEKALGKRYNFKMVSLKADNFTKLTFNKEEIEACVLHEV